MGWSGYNEGHAEAKKSFKFKRSMLRVCLLFKNIRNNLPKRAAFLKKNNNLAMEVWKGHWDLNVF